MTVGAFFTTIPGACVGKDWHDNPNNYPCPNLINITLGGSLTRIAINFNGRGKVGTTLYSGCGGSDAYINLISNSYARVNVWKAYRDGIWTSSVTFDIYSGNTILVNTPISVFYGNILLTKSAISDTVPCGTNIKATVTINDNGTVSIA